jgi:hypothetical protein
MRQVGRVEVRDAVMTLMMVVLSRAQSGFTANQTKVFPAPVSRLHVTETKEIPFPVEICFAESGHARGQGMKSMAKKESP